jgi:hypothetical protein
MSTRVRRVAALAVGVALVLVVAGCSDCDVKITTGALPDGIVGVDYSARIDSDCGGDAFFIDDGTIPPGIEFQDDGDLRGTPLVAGTFVFTVVAVDFSGGDESTKGFSITVLDAP